MPGVTSKAYLFGSVHLPQHTTAVRAVVRYLFSKLVHLTDITEDALGDLGFDLNISRNGSGLAHWLATQLLEQTTHCRERNAVIDNHIVERTLGHIRVHRIGRILYDRDASAALDRDQPRGAVVEHAGEDNAHVFRDG